MTTLHLDANEFVPYRPLAPRPRQIQRLDARRCDEADEIEAALARLTAMGLVAHRARSAGVVVMGGTSVDAEDGIRVYENGFAIVREGDGRLRVRVAGPGQTTLEDVASSLGEAVTAVLRLRDARLTRRSRGAGG